MPKRQARAPKRNKNKAQRTIFANCDQPNAILRLNQLSLMLDKLICLTDSIYGDNVPEDLQGFHFVYKIVAYDSECNRLKATYQLCMIEEDGCEWKVLDGERETMENLTYDHVKDGLELYNKAIGRINAHEYEKTAAVQESLKRKSSVSGTAQKEEDVDMSDLDETALKAKDGWKSLSVLEVSFEFTQKVFIHHMS